MINTSSIVTELENKYFMIIDALADLFWDVVIRTYCALSATHNPTPQE